MGVPPAIVDQPPGRVNQRTKTENQNGTGPKFCRERRTPLFPSSERHGGRSLQCVGVLSRRERGLLLVFLEQVLGLRVGLVQFVKGLAHLLQTAFQGLHPLLQANVGPGLGREGSRSGTPGRFGVVAA